MDQRTKKDVATEQSAKIEQVHKIPLKVLLSQLKCSREGLSNLEATRRLSV